MDLKTWAKIERVFLQARDLPPEARVAFVEKEASEEPGIRDRVRAMLAKLERTSGLQTPVGALLGAGAGPEPSPDDRVGKRIGGFEVLRLIERGGMGDVFEARQDHPRRSVALKVMRREFANPRTLKRFRFEAHTLAKLSHPNVATIYEAGIHDEDCEITPYIAMELVAKARNLGKYCEEEGLGIRERLDLFVQLCAAIEHGHQKATIHRDIKPANVLIDATGTVKVIDFGVARSLDREVVDITMHTTVGEVIGTVRYMSPEQCDGDPSQIDTRSDVYALGLVLYELLTEGFPYDFPSSSFSAALRTIHREAPRRPSTLNRAVAGDLETILLAALEKRPDDRYPSVAELREDIQRYLANRPIRVRRGHLGHRMRLFLRRNRTRLVASMVPLLVALAWFIHTSYQARRVREMEENDVIIRNAIQRYIERERPTSDARGIPVSLREAGLPIEERRFAIRLPQIGWHFRGLYLVLADDAPKPIGCILQVPGMVSSLYSKPVKNPAVPDAFLAEAMLPDHDRKVVVAAFHHPHFYPSVLRIYDAATLEQEQPLAQWWHLGHLRSAFWNEADGVIVLCGVSNALVDSVPELAAYRWADNPQADAITLLEPSRNVGDGKVMFPLLAGDGRQESAITILVRRPFPKLEMRPDRLVRLDVSRAEPSKQPKAVCRVRIKVQIKEKGAAEPKDVFIWAHVAKSGRVVHREFEGEPYPGDLPQLEFMVITRDRISELVEANQIIDERIGGCCPISRLQAVANGVDPAKSTRCADAVRKLADWHLRDIDWLRHRARRMLMFQGNAYRAASGYIERAEAVLATCASHRKERLQGRLVFLRAIASFREGECSKSDPAHRRECYEAALNGLWLLHTDRRWTRHYSHEYPFLCFLEAALRGCGRAREAMMTRIHRQFVGEHTTNVDYDPEVDALKSQLKRFLE